MHIRIGVNTIKSKLSTYFFVLLFSVLLFVTFLVIKPLFLAIVGSIIIAFVFHPLYSSVYKKTKRENLSASLVSFVLILLIIIPSFFIVTSITKEVGSVYDVFSEKLTQEDILAFECEGDGSFCNAVNLINTNAKVRFYLTGAVTSFASELTRSTSSFIFSIPKRIIEAAIMFVLIFFLFKDGAKLWKLIGELIPLKGSHKNILLNRFAETVSGVVFGYFVIAIAEAILMWIAFVLIGYPAALLIGAFTGILAMIPMVGATIIWIPVMIFELFRGRPVQGLIILVFGLIIMYLDVWVRQAIISKRVQIHPAIVLIGVLGGIFAFGFIGVIMGPLVLALLITAIEIYRQETNVSF